MVAAGNQEEEAPPNLNHPLLLITDRCVGNEKKYFYSISENRFHRASIPEFQDIYVLGSAYGWIVLANPETDDCYMWNPRSMERIELGFFKCSDMYHRCVVSQPPSEPGFCHVMFYANYDITPAHCLLLDRSIVAPPSHQHYDISRDKKVVTAASFRGKIYCILKPGLCFTTVDFDGNTVEYTRIFELDDQGSVVDPRGMPLRNPDWLTLCARNYLIGLRDELLLVKKMPDWDFRSNELDFKVFRVDVDRRECVELDSIGDRAIFVGDRADCYCCSSSSSRGTYRRNCIYYTNPHSKSRCVYAYDLDDRSTTSLIPCSIASRRTTSNWIENVFSIQP